MIHVHKKTLFRSKTLIQIMISSFMFLFMCFLEIYWMINRSYEYVVLIVFGFLICIFGILTIGGFVKEKRYYSEMIMNQHEEILNADKAVYLLVKKSFSELNEQLAEIKENKAPIFEIVEKQKSIAKFMMIKNRESTLELLNLNSKVLDELEKVLKCVELFENANTGNNDKENKQVPKLYDDPNTNLTPDEIATLFKSMGN